MSDLLSRIVGPVNVANSTSTIFTGTAAHTYTIKHISLVNNTTGAISISLGINGTANANLVMPTIPIGAGEYAEFDGMVVLSGTDTLQATTTATGLTITVSGLDQS